MSEAQSPGYGTVTIEGERRWRQHVTKRWNERSKAPGLDPRKAFATAVEVHYPSAYGGVEARYHSEGDVVFLADDRKVRTCLALGDRAAWEQAYVRNQVTENE
ncbi:hypothetical protein [Saliphagus sp. LR7]|uniref:hypothetical protein n=1 Tax=Saliphagus sp. LR7 TaxID=2282654 RepID=UPI001E5B7D3B|nr:hypothetical protein [Saliphagus sp. LR7]